MNAALFLIIGCAVLIVGYIFYGGWLAKKWGVDNSRPTPAHTMEDGKDYCPAKAPVLMGHHFSSIAGAGPINGPIQAAVFGWVPVMLWVLIGGIFFGGVHDFGALFASIRHKGESIGEVIGADYRRLRAKQPVHHLRLPDPDPGGGGLRLHRGGHLRAPPTPLDGAIWTMTASSANAARPPWCPCMFIVMAILFGLLCLSPRRARLGVASVVGVFGDCRGHA